MAAEIIGESEKKSIHMSANSFPACLTRQVIFWWCHILENSQLPKIEVAKDLPIMK